MQSCAITVVFTVSASTFIWLHCLRSEQHQQSVYIRSRSTTTHAPITRSHTLFCLSIPLLKTLKPWRSQKDKFTKMVTAQKVFKKTKKSRIKLLQTSYVYFSSGFYPVHQILCSWVIASVRHSFNLVLIFYIRKLTTSRGSYYLYTTAKKCFYSFGVVHRASKSIKFDCPCHSPLFHIFR